MAFTWFLERGQTFVKMRALKLCAVALVVAAGCSRVARRDSGPALPADAPAEAALEAARRDPQAGAALTSSEQIDHALARVTFGARPGDRERVGRIGVAAFLEEQLEPARLEDHLAEARLARYRVLTASSSELMQELVDKRKQKKEDKEQQKLALAQADPALAAATVPPPEKKGRMDQGPGGAYIGELAQAKLLRAVLSERQLQEVMADFWFNHFNVFGAKDRIRALLPSYERDAIRPNALGRFGDLLRATARHPAMLVYLDNWRSSSDSPPPRFRRAERPRAAFRSRGADTVDEVEKLRRKRGRGLNENYARELLELHTLGVDGGYSQADVTEVARCFTGWTVVEMQDDPRYAFRRGRHDFGQKLVLGHAIEAGGGEGDGEAVLELVLHHPATARFIASKLVRRFVMDDPPALLVERVAETYQSSDGDIRAMLRTIFASPDFWSRRALKAKVRSPLEFVAGAVRAVGAGVDDPLQLAKAVERIGEPLYGAAPPTGYGDTAETWVSPGALLARINFGLTLAEGKLEGVSLDLAALAPVAAPPEQVLARAQALLSASELSERTRAYVLSQLGEVPEKRRQKQPALLAMRAVGLLLGAPEWQRR